jgi:GDP-4-dehydro-6-deoxy-D-mannose reductase
LRRLLVTGRSGFVGTVLAERIAATHAGAWKLADIPDRLDLRDAEETRALIEATCPDAVVHLAAQSAVPDSVRDPETTLRVNVLGTLNLLQALTGCGFRGRLLYVGSGDIYGHVPAEALPIDETRLPRPRNPYAVSKLAAEALCWQWHVSEGRDLVLARPFNHIGPGQSDRFAVSSFARQIAEIRLGKREPRILAGNLDATRDFTDVRDVADAYLALLEQGESGEIYNVCSGVERSIRSMLELLMALGGVRAPVEQDSGRLRHSEQPRMCGDPGKIVSSTGWRPATPLETSLRDALVHWEREIQG